MIEQLLNGASQSPHPRRFLLLSLLLGAGSLADHSGRALLMQQQTPSAFAATAQSLPASIRGLNIANGTPATGGRGARRAAPAVGSEDGGTRPASFGVAPAEPLSVGGGNAPVYQPNLTTPSASVPRLQAINFVPPDDILPAAGGSAGNAAASDPVTPAVPEPSSILLAGFGMLLLGGLAWRERRRARA